METTVLEDMIVVTGEFDGVEFDAIMSGVAPSTVVMLVPPTDTDLSQYGRSVYVQENRYTITRTVGNGFVAEPQVELRQVLDAVPSHPEPEALPDEPAAE